MSNLSGTSPDTQKAYLYCGECIFKLSQVSFMGPLSQIRQQPFDFYDRLRDSKKLIVAERRDLQKYSDWRQLWYPNFEDFSRAEAMAGAENNTITNVTVQLGATAYLHCHVRSTGDRALAGAEVITLKM